jgi:multiple antibiotic resistance protein
VSDALRVLLVFLAAVNPAATALGARGLAVVTGPRSRQLAAASAGAVMVLLIVLAVLADAILDALAVEPETFRIAAGIVLAISGMAAAIRLAPSERGNGTWQDAVFPFAIPLLCGPATLMAALSYGADEALGAVIVGIVAAVGGATGLALLCARTQARAAVAALDGVARLTGALLIALGVGLVVHGVRAV